MLIRIVEAVTDDLAEENRVVLFFSGMAVSGTIISEVRFLESFIIGESLDAERAVALEDLDTNDRNKIDTIYAQVEADDRDFLTRDEDRRIEKLTAQYIHLKDVTIHGVTSGALNCPVWRGQLIDVVGWIPGYFRDEEWQES